MDKLKWTRKVENDHYTSYTARGTSYHTSKTYVIASFRNSYTGKLESHLQIHRDGQPLYLNQGVHRYGTIPQLKAEAQRINTEEHEYRRY